MASEPDFPDSYSASKCPVCYEIMRLKKIFICLEGHSICEDCFSATKKSCPQCRGVFNNQRNFQLEELITECTFLNDYVSSVKRGGIKITEFNSDLFKCADCGDFLSFSGKTQCQKCRQFTESKDQANVKLREVIQEMSKFILVPCCFSDQGCRAVVALSQKLHHEKNCCFKEVSCKIFGCVWRGKQKFLWDHFESEHAPPVVYKMKQTNAKINLDFGCIEDKFAEVNKCLKPYKYRRVYNKSVCVTFGFLCGQKVFYLNLVRTWPKVYFLMHFTGSDEEASCYFFNIKLENGKRKISLDGDCVQSEETWTQILEKKCYVCFKIEDFAKYLDGSNRIKLNISIIRK